MKRLVTTLCLLSSVSFLGSCQSAYYSAMEQFGVHKRDILVDRVEAAREDQTDAQEQFQTTMEAFQELTGFDGGDLEKVYNKLNSEYEDSEDSANAVRDRVASVEKVSTDLFREWETELAGMTNADLQSQSREMMKDTQSRYQDLIAKMRGASEKMDPVLAAFKDHVVFLKHNLNAKAISSLKDTSLQIQGDVEALIANMQASIDEADSFIASMSS